MFASNFAEARLVFDANNPPSLPLTDDNVDTALRLCGILHGCYSCDDDGTFGDSESSSTPSWSAHEDGARARQAVIDLAQLSHKWDCAESARGEILRMVGKVAGNWPSYWSKVADLTMSYFLEDAETFRGATAQVIARCDGGEAIKPTVVSKQGVTSLTQWPDLLDRPDFRGKSS